MGHRLWLPAVAIHRLGIVEIAPSPHRCFRTANPCAQSVNGSPAEPVLSRSSRQRLGHLQSHFDRGWHVCQAVFPELQPAAACSLMLACHPHTGIGTLRLRTFRVCRSIRQAYLKSNKKQLYLHHIISVTIQGRVGRPIFSANGGVA